MGKVWRMEELVFFISFFEASLWRVMASCWFVFCFLWSRAYAQNTPFNIMIMMIDASFVSLFIWLF